MPTTTRVPGPRRRRPEAQRLIAGVPSSWTCGERSEWAEAHIEGS